MAPPSSDFDLSDWLVWSNAQHPADFNQTPNTRQTLIKRPTPGRLYSNAQHPADSNQAPNTPKTRSRIRGGFVRLPRGIEASWLAIDTYSAFIIKTTNRQLLQLMDKAGSEEDRHTCSLHCPLKQPILDSCYSWRIKTGSEDKLVEVSRKCITSRSDRIATAIVSLLDNVQGMFSRPWRHVSCGLE